MNDELLEIIKKNLPAMQVDALKGELDKAAKVPDLEKRIKELQACYEAEKKLSQDRYYTIITLEGRIKTDEELEKKKRDLENEGLKKDVQCAKDTLKAVSDLAHAAFRNPMVMKTYNVPMQPDQYNSYPPDKYVTETTTKV